MASVNFYQKGLKGSDLLQSKYQDRQKGKTTVSNELRLCILRGETGSINVIWSIIITG